MHRPTDQFVRSRFTVVCAFLAFGSPAAVPAQTDDSSVLVATEVVTTVSFDQGLLSDLGIEIAGLETTAENVSQHPLSVSPPDAPAFSTAVPFSLTFLLTEGRFDGFSVGSVRHQGGFELRWRDGSVDLAGFELRPGREPRTFHILSGRGELALIGDHLHYKLDAERSLLQIFNVDLRLSRGLARRMKRPELSGLAVAVLTLDAAVVVPAGVLPEGTPPPCGDWSGDQDVQLIDLSSISQTGSVQNGQVVAVPSARLKNVGTANVPWYTKFTGPAPPYNNDQHPFLMWAAYRIANGALHQLGVSDVKHAFLTINSNCDPGACTDPHILGLGCEDVYGTSTNTSNNSLAFREEVSAGAGIWAHCDEPVPQTPSHFDESPPDCVQDFFGAGEDAYSHGLVLQEADLEVAGAQYYFTGWYVIRDDINIFNTMGYREIDPTPSGGGWVFPTIGGLVLGSPVNAWVPPGPGGASSENITIEADDGHLQLAVQATALGESLFRYEYGLMNHDFDRQIESFSVPLLLGVDVSSSSFRDIDQDGGNDWTATVTADAIEWQAPTGNALDWGTLFNFTFEANTPAVSLQATLSVLEPGTPDELLIKTLGPDSTEIFSDGFESGDTSAWTSSVQ